MTARYLTTAQLRALSTRLSQRDYAALQEIAALRFASGSQLARLCFARSDVPTADLRAARRALSRLTRLGMLERLPRRVGGAYGGSASFVYRLGPAGQRLGVERGWSSTRRLPSIPGQLFIRHTLAISELHTRLVEAGRSEQLELLERQSEPACWRSSPHDVLKPDSYVRLGVGDFEDSYFIEVDRGTEGSRTIERQLERYLNYYRSGREQAERGVFPHVLWLAFEPRRIAALAKLIDRFQPMTQQLFAVAHFNDAVSAITAGGEP